MVEFQVAMIAEPDWPDGHDAEFPVASQMKCHHFVGLCRTAFCLKWNIGSLCL